MIYCRPKVRGSVKQSVYFEVEDAATPFLPKTGLAYNTAGIVMSYNKMRGARVAITPADLAAVTDAWASGALKEVDATNEPGIMRVDLPNAALADDGISDHVIVSIKATGYRTANLFIPLIDKVDVYTSPGTTRADS